MAKLFVVTGHSDGDDPTCDQIIANDRDHAVEQFINTLRVEAEEDDLDVDIDCVVEVGEYDPATNTVALRWLP